MIDSHCHLLDVVDTDIAIFFSQLRKAGITRLWCNTISPDQWPVLQHMSMEFAEIIPFYGIHPWHVAEDSLAALEQLDHFWPDQPTFCGEIGLDRSRKNTFNLQKAVFAHQLELVAARHGLVAIHCVKAWGALLEILEPYAGKLHFMIHGFTGSREVMERIVALGGLLSYSDRSMLGKNHKSLNALKHTPLDHLLLETDFPFQKYHPGMTASAYSQTMTSLYSFVAELRQLSLQQLIDQIEHNGSLYTN